MPRLTVTKYDIFMRAETCTHPEKLHNSRQIWRFHGMRACQWWSCAAVEKARTAFYKVHVEHTLRIINL